MDLGRSISNFGNSLSGAAYQIGNANFRAQQTKNDIEKSLALTTLKENIFNNFQDKQANWDLKDDEGSSMYKSYLENFEGEQEDLWEELSGMFTNPRAADEFFPIFNEYISASRMDLDELVTNYSTQEDKITAVDTLNRLSVMPGDSLEERDANIKALIKKDVDDNGVFSAEEGRNYLESSLNASRLFEVDRIAGKALSEFGYNAARTVIQGSDLIGDDDKKKLLSKYDSEHKYQEKLKEEIHKGRREDQRSAFGESIDTGKLRNVGRLYDLAEVTGTDLEAGDLKSMAALIRQLNREDDPTKELKSNQIVLNHIGTMMNDRSHPRSEIIKVANDALEAGDKDETKGILAKDYNALIKKLDTDEFRHLNDSATKQIISEIEAASSGKDAPLQEPEAIQMIDDYYNWLTHNKWSEERFLDDTEYSNADKFQWLENRLNPYKTKRINDSIRTMLDGLALSGNEKFQIALEGGQGLGIMQSNIISSELSLPEIREDLRADLSMNLYSKPYDRLNDNQKEIVETSVKAVQHIKAQRNDLKDFAGIDNPEIRLNDRGIPIFKDQITGDFYRVKIEEKDEVWKKWVWIDRDEGTGVWDTLEVKKEPEEESKFQQITGGYNIPRGRR